MMNTVYTDFPQLNEVWRFSAWPAGGASLMERLERPTFKRPKRKDHLSNGVTAGSWLLVLLDVDRCAWRRRLISLVFQRHACMPLTLALTTAAASDPPDEGLTSHVRNLPVGQNERLPQGENDRRGEEGKD